MFWVMALFHPLWRTIPPSHAVLIPIRMSEILKKNDLTTEIIGTLCPI